MKTNTGALFMLNIKKDDPLYEALDTILSTILASPDAHYITEIYIKNGSIRQGLLTNWIRLMIEVDPEFINIYYGDSVTKEQAEELLVKDLVKFEKSVNKYNGIYNFNQNQYDALVSFAFNCGSGNLKKLLKDGARTICEISESIVKYNKAGGKVVKGLSERRKKEQILFNSFKTSKKYYPKYNGASNSITDILLSMKINATFQNRKKIATANNIINYKGTYSQNIELVRLVKKGLLVRCD